MNVYPSFPVVLGLLVTLGQGIRSLCDEPRLPQRTHTRGNVTSTPSDFLSGRIQKIRPRYSRGLIFSRV